MKFLEFTTEVSEFPNFPNFGPFPKIYFNQKTHRLKCVASWCFDKISDMFLKSTFKNVNFFFDPICGMFNIQKAPSKITRYGVNLPKGNVFAISDVGRNLRMTQKSKVERGILHNHQENSLVPKHQK